MFELVRTSLLIAYLVRDLWDAIFIGYLSVRGYNSVNFVSTAYPGFFQCRCLCYMACVEFTLVAMLCSHCTYLIDAGVGRADWNEDGYRRELQLWNAVSSSLSATPRGCCIVICSCSLGPRISGMCVLDVCLNKLWNILDIKSCHIYNLRGKLILRISYCFRQMAW